MGTVFIEPMNLGDLLKYEESNLYSRDLVTVAAGQNLPLGTVVGMVSASGKIKLLDPSATDGSQYAAGVLIENCDASLAERSGLMVARHAIVASHALNWPTSITAAEKQAATAQLKALGILVRLGV